MKLKHAKKYIQIEIDREKLDAPIADVITYLQSMQTSYPDGRLDVSLDYDGCIEITLGFHRDETDEELATRQRHRDEAERRKTKEFQKDDLKKQIADLQRKLEKL